MLGYDWNDGGINNQKLALLGLFVKATQTRQRAIYLPKIYSKDQHDTRSGIFPLGEVYEIDRIIQFAKRWNISITEPPVGIKYADRVARAGWDFFGAGACSVGEATKDLSFTYATIAADFFRSLVPTARSLALTHRLLGEVFGRLKVDTVVQLRIEEDWYNYSHHHLSKVVHEPEDYYITAPEIIAKVKHTFPEVEQVYVSCDERYIFAPKAVISKEVKDHTGVQIIWKSDLLSVADFDSLPPVTASLIDFEVAKTAERFVGMTRSTFANLVAFERFAAAFRDRQNDYVYNLPGLRLGQRIDAGGVDNPKIACGLNK